VSELITSITSTILHDVQLRFQHPASWPDPASGFAFRLLEAACLPLPSAYQEPLRHAGVNILRRSPDLAAFGYVIRTAASLQVQTDWSQAFTRLMGREVFTPDRNSFIFNPLELLGIAFGASDCPSITDGQRGWLGAQIDRAFAGQHFTGTLPQLFAQCARQRILPSEVRRNIPLPDTSILAATTPDLCMISALAILFPTEAAPNVAATESEIIRRLLAEPLPVHDAAEAAAVYVTLRRAIDRAVIHPSLESDAVERTVALCRRFQLFVDRLQQRQRGRPAFEIKNEYDVQDLLHGILKLHFDDVRPEEWTPSYAGNSSRVDFYLKRERTIVEAKMTRKGLDQKEVANQLIIDTARYGADEKVDKLVCFVYDPERRCTNPTALESDLTQTRGRLRVAVVVCPVGT
jgi:hypothetical protein